MVNLFKGQRWMLAILILAAILRFFLLEIKPPHFDEGVNGWFVDEMVKHGYFHYDPENYHGPLHFYILFLFQTLFGRHIWALRVPTILFNLASIWLVTRFDKFIPKRVCQLAALAMALSAGEIFYSRYAIHEAELGFFLLLATWGLFQLWQTGDRKGLWAVGLAVTGMLLTKETYIIHIVCFALTGACLWAWGKLVPKEASIPAKQLWDRKDLAVVGSCSLLLVLFFYSGNFLDPGSLKGLYQTYAAWVKTGTHGNGHEKGRYYWLYLIGVFEWPVAIGLVYGACWVVIDFFRGLNGLGGQAQSTPATLGYRFLAIYGCGALTAYSLVPYKTPWCIITLIWPFFFLFGKVIHRLWTEFAPAESLSVAAPLLGASLGVSVWLNFFHYADESVQFFGRSFSIPYVYVQTTNDLRKITGPLFRMTALDPANYAMTGHIMLGSYYPLPWVLGDFTQLGYFNADNDPKEMDADFLLADADRVEKVEATLKDSYFRIPVRLRSGMEISQFYLRESKFKPIFPDRVPEFDPK